MKRFPGKSKSSVRDAISRPLEGPLDISYQVVAPPGWVAANCAPGALRPGEELTVSKPQDLRPVLDYLASQSIHGIDLETGGTEVGDGLDPVSGTSEILLCQYGTESKIFILAPELMPEFKSLIQSDKHLHLGHNIVHEMEFTLAKQGLVLVRMYDTMLAEQSLKAGLSGVRVSLRDLARHYPPHHLISKDVREQFVEFRPGMRFTREMLYYAARDVALLFPVFRGQLGEIESWNLKTICQDEMNVIPVTAEMELTGVDLDKEILLLAVSPYVQRAEEIRTEVRQLYNQALTKKGRAQQTVMTGLLEELDLDSNQKKLEALQELGFDIKDVKRETLELLGTELSNLLGEYSKCTKMISTYGQNLVDRCNKTTGKFHPEFHQLGIGENLGGKAKKSTLATGRYSSDFQQIPRPKKEFRKVTDSEELARVQVMFAESLAKAKAEGAVHG